MKATYLTKFLSMTLPTFETDEWRSLCSAATRAAASLADCSALTRTRVCVVVSDAPPDGDRPSDPAAGKSKLSISSLTASILPRASANPLDEDAAKRWNLSQMTLTSRSTPLQDSIVLFIFTTFGEELTEGLGPRAVPALGSLFPLAQDPIQLMRDCTWCSSSALFFGVHEHLHHHDLIILSVSPSPPLWAWLGSGLSFLLLSNLAQLRTLGQLASLFRKSVQPILISETENVEMFHVEKCRVIS